jgi:hypothetical protein
MVDNAKWQWEFLKIPVNQRIYDILLQGVCFEFLKDEFLQATWNNEIISGLNGRYLYINDESNTGCYWIHCKKIKVKLTNSSRKIYLAKAKSLLGL